MDAPDYLRFVAALVFVLGLILALAWIARRSGLAPLSSRARPEEKRLDIVEVRSIDARRQLVIIRRDSVEHLLLLGPSGDVLIEGNIPARPSDEFNRVMQSQPQGLPWPRQAMAALRQVTGRRI